MSDDTQTLAREFMAYLKVNFSNMYQLSAYEIGGILLGWHRIPDTTTRRQLIDVLMTVMMSTGFIVERGVDHE